MNIILCGLPCTGKSTLGLQLSQALDRPFIDSDTLIEERYGEGLTCRELYAAEGELNFRQYEKEVIGGLQCIRSVIALGGGSCLAPDNQAKLKAIGTIIYLKAPIALVWERLQKKTTPSNYLAGHLTYEQFALLANKRRPIYERIAAYQIDINALSTASILAALIDIGKQHGE